MRKREIKKVNTLVETSVTCDDCGENCLNTNYEIFAKSSFLDKPEHIKDVCWGCYHKNDGIVKVVKKTNNGRCE